jgi:hypothetical protein
MNELGVIRGGPRSAFREGLLQCSKVHNSVITALVFCAKLSAPVTQLAASYTEGPRPDHRRQDRHGSVE